ncbi:hypothetical protein FHL15_009143 [Xylaria flabelliformis]|uniref:ER-bound oxygenase mpaB/mpaB'/Rubber oxygenase catalytic domain-containing protein n=1 Tax=Xylaria flabelliformis TaxID=2512241 RepID=A0A553HQ14_9PEZI|nr:hypothetical protein FHL15_009143 [Xylaria flabelliformis]
MDAWPWASLGRFSTPTGGIGVLVILYVILCTTLRFKQMRAIANKFGYTTRASFADMTVDDAYRIQRWLAEQEFPKTYGVPSISKLLVQTGHFTYRGDGTKASKRAADTSVLLTNMVIGRPGSRRAMEAVARTNYLHSRYLKTGRISDDDMLYTLSLFTLEGMRWTDLYEWRRLTPMERCAMATFWKALGEDLQITYRQLPSYQSGWSDGLHWLEELDGWSRHYEAKYMRPDDSNAFLAESTINLALHTVPDMFKPLARQLVALLLTPQLREAMRLFISLRKVLLRHLFLPRPYFLRHHYIEENPDPLTNRYHVSRWRFHPWYATPSFKDRWGAKAWIAWVAGNREGGLGTGKFIPEGYLLPEVGPQEEIGRGLDDMEGTVNLLASKDPHRRPFARE